MKHRATLLLLLGALSASAQILTTQEVAPQIIIPQESVPQDEVQIAINPQDTLPKPPKPIKEHLLSPVQVDSLTTIYETVHVTEFGDAATIIERNLKAEPQTISGYRVVIFMKNAQSARREAVVIQDSLAQRFPQEQSYLTYENPYFKLSVGNCTTPEEAMTLLGRLRATFPKAFVVRENINVEEFAR